MTKSDQRTKKRGGGGGGGGGSHHLTQEESLKLSQMLRQSGDVCGGGGGAEDNTAQIRRLQHSGQIRESVTRFLAFQKEIGGMPVDEMMEAAKGPCFFLYQHYTDLYFKLVKGELDVSILHRMLDVLALIENEEVDQHEGSVLVGKILKEMYVDSARRRADSVAAAAAEADVEPVSLSCGIVGFSYADFKREREQQQQRVP